MDGPRPRYLTVPELAQRWSVSPQYVRMMLKRGDLPGARLPGNIIRIPQAVVEELEQEPAYRQKAAETAAGSAWD